MGKDDVKGEAFKIKEKEMQDKIKQSNSSFESNGVRFDRDKNYRGEDVIHVRVKDGGNYMHLTTIYQDEMKKKKLDFYSNKDVEYFKKTYL